MDTLAVVDATQPIDYAAGTVPSSYTCGHCGVSGVKLWRDVMAVATDVTLRCFACASIEDETSFGCDIRTGKHPTGRAGEPWTDQFRHRLPAIPTPDNRSFWGYTAVPPDALKWWYGLPI